MAINESLISICNNMLDQLKTEPSIECLRDLRFDLEESPDYSKSLNQQLYLLRYLYAYHYEYYKAFNDMFGLTASDVKSEYYNVLSIGCGVGFDYSAFKCVLRNNKIDEFVQMICYNGIDTIRWKYSCKKEGYDLFNVDTQDFRTWLDENADIFSKSDIFLFPKSIGEFPDDYFLDILNMLKRKELKVRRQSIAIIGSFRKSKHDSDTDRFDRFVKQVMASGGYTKKNSIRCYRALDIDFPKIHNVMTWIPPYPEKITMELLNLNKHCNKFIKQGCCCEHPNCQDSMVFKNPITTTRYFDYKVVILKRGDL